MRTLPSNFYAFPRIANTTMSRSDLKELLLSTDGWILTNGRMWDIKSKPMGAGVHRVSLKLKESE